jgi:hypothetical protein
MSAIAQLPRQIRRGATDLPHVGPHPGTAIVAILIAITALAGGQSGGVQGFAIGAGLGVIVYGTFFACGAIDRARISDAYVRRERLTELFAAWIGTLGPPPGKAFVLHMVMRKSNRGQALVASAISTDPVPEIPEALRAEMERVLTHPVGATGIRRTPRTEDLRTIAITTREMSAHEKIEAIATISAITGTSG